MAAVVNLWILYEESIHEDVNLLQYVIALAEILMRCGGKQLCRVQRKQERGRRHEVTSVCSSIGRNFDEVR